MILVSPTEHELVRVLPESRVSSMPERHGCDVVAITRNGLIGFQRKTLPDLQASLHDGRLYKELAQLEASASISYGYLIIESSFKRTTDDSYVDVSLSVNTVRSIICKFHAFGMGYLPTDSINDTATAIVSVSKYLGGSNVEAIKRPKQLSNKWGNTDSESFSIFLLQSFPGIGPSLARAIYRHFGGVPVGWTITAKDLGAVDGIGRKRAEQLIAALNPPTRLPK